MSDIKSLNRTTKHSHTCHSCPLTSKDYILRTPVPKPRSSLWVAGYCRIVAVKVKRITSRTEYSTQTPKNSTLFSGQYLRNHWTLDIGVVGYIGIVWPKEHSPEVWHIPPGTPCTYIYIYIYIYIYQRCNVSSLRLKFVNLSFFIELSTSLRITYFYTCKMIWTSKWTFMNSDFDS